MFSQILKDLITLHKLDSVGNVKTKDKENKLNKLESKSSTNNNKSSNYVDSFSGLKKSEAHSDLAKEFRFKSNQSNATKYNDSSASSGAKTSFGLKNQMSGKLQSSQAKLDNINSSSGTKRSGVNNLDSKSSVNFYFSSNDKSQKSEPIIDLKSSSNKQTNDYKSRDFKNTFAVVNDHHNSNHHHQNDNHDLNAHLPSKNQNGSDASLRTRKQDALIDLAILLKKSQSKINLNGKLEDSTKLFEIQATLANEFKTAMINKNEQEAKAAAEKAAAAVAAAAEKAKKAEITTANNNNISSEPFNPKYEALTKLTDEFRKNFTEIKKAYLSKDPQIVSNMPPEDIITNKKTENQLSNDFKNSTAQINKSLKNLESKSSATFNSKFLLKQDLQQNSTIANEFKLSSSRKNLASKSSANFFTNPNPKTVKSDVILTNDLTNEQPIIRKTLASKSSANLYEPSNGQVLKSNTQANLANEFKLNSATRKGLTSKSSANLYTIDANTGTNMYKSDTQPNLAREFKSSFAQLKTLKDTFAKSSTNISASANTANTNTNNTNYSQHNLKNMYIQSNEYGDTYIVQRPDQTMTLTNEFKNATNTNSDLRINQEATKSSYNLTKTDSNPIVAMSKELKKSTTNLNELTNGLNKKKTNNSAELRKSTMFSTNKDLKAYEHQAKLVNEFRALASRSTKNLESKSSSTFFLNSEAQSSLMSQPSQISNKLDTQTSLAREFKKSFTNLNLKDASKTSGISSIYLSTQSDSPVTDSSVDYEVNAVMNQQKSSNHISEYKTAYIQQQQPQPILVGNFNKVGAEESQELLIELERTGISSSTPIEAINETRDSDLQNLNASELQKWIWTNEQEANNSLSPIPLNEYPINQDPNPIVIKKKPDQKVELKKEFFVRYLQPPRPLTPGKLIIEQEANVIPPEAPPIVIRQRPNRNRTPEPIIIREAPPTPPPVPPKQIITIPGKTIRQPREIIYEQPPKVKCEPQVVCHESCMPCNYCYQNGNMFQESWHPYNNGSNVTYQNQNVFHETWVPYKSNNNNGNVYAQNQMPPSWISYNNQPMFNQPPWNPNPNSYSNMPPPYNYKYY